MFPYVRAHVHPNLTNLNANPVMATHRLSRAPPPYCSLIVDQCRSAMAMVGGALRGALFPPGGRGPGGGGGGAAPGLRLPRRKRAAAAGGWIVLGSIPFVWSRFFPASKYAGSLHERLPILGRFRPLDVLDLVKLQNEYSLRSTASLSKTTQPAASR